MASSTQWTGVWVDSGSWWWTGRPGILWFMGSQRVGHSRETELNWLNLKGLGFLSLSRHVGELTLPLCISVSSPWATRRKLQKCAAAHGQDRLGLEFASSRSILSFYVWLRFQKLLLMNKKN